MINHGKTWQTLQAIVIKASDGWFALELRHIWVAHFIREEVTLQVKWVGKEAARSAIEVLCVHS